MGIPVYLNVYDLTNHNAYTYWCGVGIFHAGTRRWLGGRDCKEPDLRAPSARGGTAGGSESGVEVYGTEYAYGGHEFDYTGVFATSPKDAPGQVLYRESVYIGETDLTQEEVHQLILKMGQEYKGNRYHLLQRNCNHFANDLVYQLTGHPAPSWINRLAGIAIMLHCLLPTTWVPPLQSPLQHTTESRRALMNGKDRSDAYAIDRAPHSSVIVTPPSAHPSSSLLSRA